MKLDTDRGSPEEGQSDLGQRLISALRDSMWATLSLTTMKRTPEAEMAWAAGFFDGEGTTHVQKNQDDRRYLSLSLGNTNLEQINRFIVAVSGRSGGIHRRSSPGSLGKKPFYMWRVARHAEAERIADLLWPYLGDEKREQIANARKRLEGQLPPYFVARLRNHPKERASVRGHFSTLLDNGLFPEEALVLTTPYRDFLVRTRRKARRCSVDDCNKDHASNGFCHKHLWRWQNWGHPINRGGQACLLESQREPREDA